VLRQSRFASPPRLVLIVVVAFALPAGRLVAQRLAFGPRMQRRKMRVGSKTSSKTNSKISSKISSKTAVNGTGHRHQRGRCVPAGL
jgi:hypothetical protein